MVTDKILSDVGNALSKPSADGKDFWDVKEKLDKTYLQILTKTGANDKGNRLFVLRRFNSFTPALPTKSDVKGGGYLLFWEKKCIAIDPGFNFIENLDTCKMSIGDIDAILVSHAHNDHYIDLDPILTLVHELNDIRKKVAYLVKEEDEEKLKQIALEIVEDHPSIKLSKILKRFLEVEINKDVLKEVLTGIEYHSGPDKKIDIILGPSAEKLLNCLLNSKLIQKAGHNIIDLLNLV